MLKSMFRFKRDEKRNNVWNCFVKGIELKELCIIKIAADEIESEFGESFVERNVDETVSYAYNNRQAVYEVPFNVNPEYFLTLDDAKKFVKNLSEIYSLEALIEAFKDEA